MKEKIIKQVNSVYLEMRKFRKDTLYFNYLCSKLVTLLDLLEVKELITYKKKVVVEKEEQSKTGIVIEE